MPDSTTPDGVRHAVVIGSGIAGLLAARVLAEHFDRITVVERDRPPPGPEFRPGVPQARHVHALLVRGRILLERLFPGFGAELAAAGAERLEWPADIVWYGPFGWGGRERLGLVTYSCGRELLESVVRRRLAGDPRVVFLDGYQVAELVADVRGEVDGVVLRSHGDRAPAGTPSSGAPAVTGSPPLVVRAGAGSSPAILRAGAGSSPPILRAELVVDASGRDSRAPRWLQSLGFSPPAETVVNAFLGYASRYYHRTPGEDPPWRSAIVQRARPRGTRSGVLAPLEGDRWILTLAGAARDYPPTDEEGFLDFARTLPHPILYDTVRDLAPASPIWGYRRTENRLRHYERLARRPERFVVLGDAACAFNPAYGQGMTVAAIHAATLHRCLRAQRAARPDGILVGFADRFQRELARDLRVPWLMATGEDFRHPATEGPRPGRLSRVTQRYLDLVIERANSDAVVQHAFLEVVHLLRRPTALFRPEIALRVLGPWERRAASSLPPPPPPGRLGLPDR